jgi:hypothetical protein
VFCSDGDPSGGQDKLTDVVCIPFYHEVSHDHSYDSHSSFNNPKGNTFLLVVCSAGGHETVCFIASR